MADLIPPQNPIIFDGTPASIVKEARDIVERSVKLWEEIEENSTLETVTVENFASPLLHDENEWFARRQVLCFYASISSSEDIREASSKASDIFDSAVIDLYLRQGLYSLADSLLKRHTDNHVEIEPEILRFLQQFHFGFVQNGCGLPDGPGRESFREGLKQLNEYRRVFQRNLYEDKSGIWVSEEDLQGVPADFFNRVKRGDGENHGSFWVPMKISFVSTVLAYAAKEWTRRRIFTLFQNRLNDKNIPLHRNMVLLRDRLARQLGFPNHAAWKVQERMIDHPEKIMTFLNDIRGPLVSQGQKEAAKLLKLKQLEAQSEESDPASTTLFYWDHLYYDRLADESGSTVNFSDVSEYFELHRTLAGLMGIYEHLFSIKFLEITPERAIDLLGHKAQYLKPHEDGRVFSLWDQEPESFLAYMYFDFHPRHGKYNHQGHYSLQLGYTQRDGTRFYPSAAIVMNYTPPTDEKPCLLTMDQVRSLFHEIGHGLHNALSVTKIARFHGTRVERDFVEAPSMMFEYFFWTPLHIKEVSYHYAHLSPKYAETWKSENQEAEDLPPKQLLDDTIEKLLELKHANKPLKLLRNLHFAIYDMIVHSPRSHEELAAMNLCEVFNKTRNEIMSLQGGEALGEGWEWAHFESLFRHINGGSYDVGYYAYVMGRIWALDIFDSTFKKNTTNKEAGRRYRDMVLRPGGSQPAMVALTTFLGREPRPDAFNVWMGIEVAGQQA